MTSLEEGIRTLFTEIDENCEVTEFVNVAAEDNFSVVLRTKLTNKENNWGDTCNKWLEKFTIQTNSQWLVRATFPAAKRMEYRKVFICKGSHGRNNKSNGESKRCESKIDMKVKKVTRDTVKKDKYLKAGYNGEIKVCSEYNI